MKTSFVKILRPAWDRPCDCTNGGVSGRVNSATLFSDCSVEEAIEYCKTHNMRPEDQLIFVSCDLWGEDHSIVEPLVRPAPETRKVIGPMFGGNFWYTSDSRLYRFGGDYHLPIPIHDRFETEREYSSYD